MSYLLYYLAFMTLLGFLAMGEDKRRAARHKWRIPERTLFLIAACGGSVGTIAGMYTFRHKTRHRSFVFGMPAILLAQLLLAWLIFRLTT